MKFLSLLATPISLACSSIPAFGILSVYEPFNYSTGALAGNSPSAPAEGFTGSWSSSGSNQQTVVGGLSFTGLSTTGNAARRTSASGGAESSIILSSTAISELTPSDGTIYFTVLLRNERFSVGNENLAFAFGTGPFVVPGSDGQNPTISGGEGFGVHLDGRLPNDGTIDIYGYQIDNGVSSQSLTKIDNDSSINTFLIAGQIDWVSSGLDTLTLFNISDPTSAALPTSFATMSADLNQALFNTIAFESQQVSTIDEIRFGTNWSDVGLTGIQAAIIPEPSTAILGLVGSLMLLRRRRD